MRAFTAAAAALVASCCALGCGRAIDLSHSLQLQTVSSGWVDARTVDGKTKLVPTISFTLKNDSDRTLSMLQVNALFRRVGDEDEWGSSFVTVAGSKGLAPGEASAPLTTTSPVGYTGLDSRSAMLGHLLFVDARVDLFAKYGSAPWTRLGRYAIPREWLARSKP